MKLEIYKGRDGQWYVRLRARNGRVMLQLEGYTKKSGALRAAGRLVSTDWRLVKLVVP